MPNFCCISAPAYYHPCYLLWYQNICLFACESIKVFSGYVLRNGISGSYHEVVMFLVFKEPPDGSPLWLYQFTCPLTMSKCSFFSTLSPAFIICRCLMLSIFSCAYWPFVCLLWINICLGLFPTF